MLMWIPVKCFLTTQQSLVLRSLDEIHFSKLSKEKPKKLLPQTTKLQETIELESFVNQLQDNIAENQQENIMLIRQMRSTTKRSRSNSPSLKSIKSKSKKKLFVDETDTETTILDKDERNFSKNAHTLQNILVLMGMEEAYEENIENKVQEDYTGMSSLEIIDWCIKKQTHYKESVVDYVPVEQYLRVKAIADMKPFHIFPLYQASTVLSFRKNHELIILSQINEDWIIGFSTATTRQPIKIIPITYVVLEYQYLPRPKRTYTIQNWEYFGFPEHLSSTEDVLAQPRFNLQVTDPYEYLKKDEPAQARMVCCANQDFNIGPHRAYLAGDIPLLAFRKNEIVIITKLPNKVEWCEGYVLYQKKIRLGIFPYSFVNHMRLKLE